MIGLIDFRFEEVYLNEQKSLALGKWIATVLLNLNDLWI